MSSFTMSYRKVGNREHRRDKRLPLPIFTIRLNGLVCDTLNWSLGGLLVSGYEGQHDAEDLIEVDIKIKDTTGDYALKISARVVRVDQRNKTIAPAVRGNESCDLRLLRAQLLPAFPQPAALAPFPDARRLPDRGLGGPGLPDRRLARLWLVRRRLAAGRDRGHRLAAQSQPRHAPHPQAVDEADGAPARNG